MKAYLTGAIFWISTAIIAAPNDDLLQAAAEGRTPMLRQALNEGANINAVDKDGYTALMKAAEKGHLNFVTVLIRMKANVNFKNPKDGRTALMYAAELGDVKIVRALINADADLTIVSKTGQTALIWAQFEKHADVVEILKQAGAKK